MLNPFSTAMHFYHEFWVRLDNFIYIRKGLWSLHYFNTHMSF
ncbi:hypothetical protein E2C01_017400 [Portunus trituberculatus]|uniref:Uncharacterized protein n=1 Tax=Portunus trituberculatus TaxID=210409 RepID=A0A5B7DSC4_PORTR|nr:hypothetical protein [Portunus trituberculatus]